MIGIFLSCLADQQEVLHFKELSDAISAVSFIIKLHSTAFPFFFPYFLNFLLQIKTKIKKQAAKDRAKHISLEASSLSSSWHFIFVPPCNKGHSLSR